MFINSFYFIRYLVIQRSFATKDLGCIRVDVPETLRYALSDKWGSPSIRGISGWFPIPIGDNWCSPLLRGGRGVLECINLVCLTHPNPSQEGNVGRVCISKSRSAVGSGCFVSTLQRT